MKKYKLLINITIAIFVTASNAIADNIVLPFYNSEEFTPNWIDPHSPELENFHRIPAFSFTNQNGETVDQETFKDKIFVASFFFSTCPGICPAIRSKLIKVQEKFLEDDVIKLLSHSIRPSTDTVQVLLDYAQDHGIVSDKWHLVTGDKEEIYSLAKSAYFASEDLGNIQDIADFLHTENVLLIDQNKHIRGVYNGLNASSMTNLIDDIIMLKAEISGL